MCKTLFRASVGSTITCGDCHIQEFGSVSIDRDTVPALLQGGYSSSSGGGSSGYGSSSGGGSTTTGSGLTAGGGNGGTTAGGATSNPLYPASNQAGSAGEDFMTATRLDVQASLSCCSMRPESAAVPL